jgi:hypothetical protein
LPTVYSAYESLAALRVPILGAVVNGTQGDHYHSRYASAYYNTTVTDPNPAESEAAVQEPTPEEANA